jgi:pyridoxine kinase
MLCSCRIASPLDAMRACLELHQLGVVNVVITSVDFSSGSDKIHVFASSKAQKQWTYSWHSCIKYPEYFSGTGDLFSALFLAWYHKTNDLNRSIVST